MGGVVTAVFAVLAVLLTLAYPMAMLAAAVTAGAAYAVVWLLARSSRPERRHSGTDETARFTSTSD